MVIFRSTAFLTAITSLPVTGSLLSMRMHHAWRQSKALGQMMPFTMPTLMTIFTRTSSVSPTPNVELILNELPDLLIYLAVRQRQEIIKTPGYLSLGWYKFQYSQLGFGLLSYGSSTDDVSFSWLPTDFLQLLELFLMFTMEKHAMTSGIRHNTYSQYVASVNVA